MADVSYAPEALGFIASIEDALGKQLAVKPKRLAHSLSVAKTAESMALLYGVDPYEARVAGALHDWSKAMPKDELLTRARDLDIDLGVDLELVEPLLHGMVAAKELPDVFDGLSNEVLHAIRVHTTGCAEPSPLDMVVFVADGIEPLRKSVPDIERVREMVGKASLEDLYWTSFTNGIAYVLRTERYLWPGTIDIYNELARGRAQKKEHE